MTPGLACLFGLRLERQPLYTGMRCDISWHRDFKRLDAHQGSLLSEGPCALPVMFACGRAPPLATACSQRWTRGSPLGER
jgi:hypothetical protein